MGTPKIPYFFLSPAILVLCLIVTTVAHAGEGGGRQQAWVEPGVDRPGSDFKILWLRGGPGACQEACSQNPLCKSYTYVREGVAGRLEGCWLKDGVPPRVEDPCCISGVKTGEVVSRITGEPAPPAGETAGLPAGPTEQTLTPGTPGGKPEIPIEIIPVTGSGKRDVAGMNFTAAPPKAAEVARIGLPGIPFPAADAGTGRKEVKGLDFASAPPSTTVRAVSRPVPAAAAAEAPGTGRGRRDIGGVHYTAAPPSGTKPVPGDPVTGSATRKITGVDITAVPPQR